MSEIVKVIILYQENLYAEFADVVEADKILQTWMAIKDLKPLEIKDIKFTPHTTLNTLRKQVEQWRDEAKVTMNNGDGTALLHAGGQHTAYKRVLDLIDNLDNTT